MSYYWRVTQTMTPNMRQVRIDKSFHSLFFLSALVSTFAVATIAVFIFIEGLPALQSVGVGEFVTGSVWNPPGYFGILPMISGSVFSTLGAIAIGVPMGLLTAVFLAEIAPERVAYALRTAIELLAGIPSVIYGFFGLVVIVPLIEQIFGIPAGNTTLAGIIVLAIMILPTVITLSETSLRAVPQTYREGSLALGASKIFTIFKVVIPAARSGILTGVILGIARAIGETMAIIMVMGNAPMIAGLLQPSRTLTANIALEMSYASGLHANALYATGIVLFIFIMLLNSALLYLNRKKVS
ncbi:phosphate ABC transporter permease [Endozoicomonas montiporae]|uniref:Phosphate transport system permease protein n=2 Tax=Endozoicomonas montiporae TaxID=1027273 RepID=A0A081N8E7_9GAMM|nr:phosphate ABC transporter permease subunit PstC [Endozoicomonas montiporae]AMO55390.1 phosphate ABC transporter permease [Endozoicomonas montiporae CL-33]KEQ14720.1 phosphate ABC transporter permease [Endozoicomonas montiporae]